MNVEIKCLPWEPDADCPSAPVVRAVVEQRACASATDVIVSSFELDAVDACRELAPELTTAWLTSGQELATAIADRGRARAPVVAPRSRRRAGVDARRHRARARATGCGSTCGPSTIPTRSQRSPRSASTRIITNVPDVVLDALLTLD